MTRDDTPPLTLEETERQLEWLLKPTGRRAEHFVPCGDAIESALHYLGRLRAMYEELDKAKNGPPGSILVIR